MKTSKPSTKRTSAPRASNRANDRPWRIVGIGCSAGGLEASQQFLDHLPPDTGLAFVVVSHLDPERKGVLPELLQRHTKIRDESLATHLFRIVQEAVNNALRHGKARRIEIQLSRQKASLVLKVRDDGVGIGLQPQPGRQGMGLHTMRYRAEAIGADLEIEATRPTGTLVSCRLANFSAPQPKAQRQEQPPASRKPKTAKSRRTTKGQQGTS